eukprot:TRINITY_DN19826_c0_g1_i1.p1 TRINITY_DN19826_c0_g1~~TRINITY_DN19826_c0_g1_i1.p1  ORF type:complete len:246 (+),score=47.63 TRINITY_DN19826_c0_g1_i1:83-820(+)
MLRAMMLKNNDLTSRRSYCHSNDVPIELEKKFKVEQPPGFLKNAQLISQKTFTDTYFDNNQHQLTCNDIWLRLRGEAFECKVPMKFTEERNGRSTGRYQGVARYKEFSSNDQIMTFLSQMESQGVLSTFSNETTSFELPSWLQSRGILPLWPITTTRTKYHYQGFTVDLDTTDVGYSIGEVELMTTSNHEGAIDKCAKDIADFCDREGLDTQGVILGKVLELVRRKHPDVFEKWKHHGLFNETNV